MISRINSISDLLELLSITSEFTSPIYRGHSRSHYTIQSAATRRLFNSYKVNPSSSAFVGYHSEFLIDNAKSMHYHYVEAGKKLSDLELLASLQHQGAATALLDFSKNISVALWFACRNVEHDGSLYIIDDSTDISFFRPATQNVVENMDISSILLNTNTLFYVWEPPGIQTRVLQQDSIFIFGLNEESLNKKAQKIIIASTAKKDILTMIDRAFNISLTTLFKDMTGFSLSNSQNDSLATTRAKKYYLLGNEAYQQRDYNKAINMYSLALETEQASLELLNRKGRAALKLEDHELAHKCFMAVLEKEPEYPKAELHLKHLNRIKVEVSKDDWINDPKALLVISKSYNVLEEHEISIEYLQRAAKFDNPDPEIYFWLGIVNSQVQKYFTAIEYYKKALYIDPTKWRWSKSMSIAYKEAGNNDLSELWLNLSRKLKGEDGESGKKEASNKVKEVLKDI